MKLRGLLALSLFCALPGFAADGSTAPNKIFEAQLTSLEHEFVPLVEAMPADKFGFAPTQGEFKGVRTFAAQAKHVAAVIHMVSAAILDEKMAADEKGPDSVTSKDDVVKYVKDSFAHAHKAVASITNANLLQLTGDPFDPKSKQTRLSSANIILWHSFDHYGQMVEYLRMNGLVPPASR